MWHGIVTSTLEDPGSEPHPYLNALIINTNQVPKTAVYMSFYIENKN